MSKQSLLLVDGDTRSMRVLEVSLRKAGFTVTTAVSVQDALDKLELDAPDLIISETTFPDGDGFELRRRVRATPEWDEIPFIFLTAEAAIENKIRGLELGVDDYLTKPIYIKEIVTRINILLQKRQRVRFEERRDGRTRFAGRVADMPVVDVIQTIEISRKSGVIQFTGDRGRSAAIYFRDGRVIDAEAGSLQGEDAVYRLLTWSEGEFEVVFRTVRRREVIKTSSQGLLMEGMRRLDEWSRLLEQLPPLTHRFEVDAGELAVRLGDIPDENNSILRLIDGKRTLLEVIDASDVGDLECLQAISKLYFEEMLIDLDHGKPARRDTGKPIPLVELESPTPIEEVASGPHTEAEPEHRVSDSSIVEEALEPAPRDTPPPGALMGGYRQSSLRLIDEAVAAAQAIEPSLFDDEIDAAAARGANGQSKTNGVGVVGAAVDDDDSVPQEIAQDEPTPPLRDVHQRITEPMAVRGRREDSGLRMIGSLGRDRAEASGELSPGVSAPKRSETQRELVTILPRRITRELPAVGADGSTEQVTPRSTPAIPAMPAPVAIPATPIVPPSALPPTSRMTMGSGVVRRANGPGAGAKALMIVAGVLTAVAVYLYLSRGGKEQAAVVPSSDAGIAVIVDAAPSELDAAVASAALDAGAEAPADAARVARDAGTVARVDAGTVPVPDKNAQLAKQFEERAKVALAESEFDEALSLTDQGLKLRSTARLHVLRARALQRLGRIDDALAALESAERASRRFAEIYEVRVQIYRAQGKADEMHQAMRRYLEVAPNGSKVREYQSELEKSP
ncbi:MAG TPA: DUF4388 domain-containing protein [Kofleriaceae bacterium]|nr:DUF4388 domain-containing protein [Kofleriaceae bacterium]